MKVRPESSDLTTAMLGKSTNINFLKHYNLSKTQKLHFKTFIDFVLGATIHANSTGVRLSLDNNNKILERDLQSVLQHIDIVMKDEDFKTLRTFISDIAADKRLFKLRLPTTYSPKVQSFFTDILGIQQANYPSYTNSYFSPLRDAANSADPDDLLAGIYHSLTFEG